jgi:hypothetical protein
MSPLLVSYHKLTMCKLGLLLYYSVKSVRVSFARESHLFHQRAAKATLANLESLKNRWPSELRCARRICRVYSQYLERRFIGWLPMGGSPASGSERACDSIQRRLHNGL